MSDIAVKKLAEMIKAPVEVLLKQLQDAGIHVDGPDAFITDAEKLRLLAHMRHSGGTAGATSSTSNPKTGGSKITLKRRSSGEMSVSGGRGKTVNVEVRRKKTIATPTAKSATSSAVSGDGASSQTEKLVKQLEAERQAREAAIQKAEKERRELEARRMAGRDEPEVEVLAQEQEPAVEETVEIDTSPTTVEEVSAPEPEQPPIVTPEKPVAEQPEVVKADEEVVVEKDNATQSPEPEAVQTLEKPQSEPEKVVDEHVEEQQPADQEVTPASSSVKTADEKQVMEQEQPVVNETPAKKPEVTKPSAPISLKEQRAAVAENARREAAAALKRRPSRAKKKPVAAAPAAATPAPEKKEVAKTAATPANATPAKPNANTNNEERRPAKKGPRHVRNAGGRDDQQGAPSSRRRNKKKGGRQDNRPNVQNQAASKHAFEKPTAPVVKEIEIPPTIVVSDLAQKLAIRATEIIKSMMKMGMMVTINQSIDQDTAILVTEELGHKAKPMQEMDDASMLAAMIDQDSDYSEQTRPPVVTIMGHVDHGKTSLLDYIRATRVAAGEAGGITQHIGAYHVDTDHGTVTFLDTPGHAAFTKMRARGAQVTDIVILIVAADDGVMPQTKEAIQHAKAAEVPMVVVINKIDKEEADPDRVLNELSQHDVLTEDWGGEVPVVRVSAKTGQGIDELLETLLLVAEVQELTAAVESPAKGNVIEASIEKGRGAVATVLVRSGTLRKGDLLLCGTEYGRVRAMFDERGRPVKEAGPSIPVAVLGLSAAPEAGEEVVVLNDERKAREIAELRRDKQRDSRFAEQQSAKLDNLFDQMKAGARAQVNLLVKADVQGSVEALRSELTKLSNDEIEVRVVSSGVGGINESDVDLAAASKAIVLAFNVRADASARKTASEEGVEIRYYSIIYDVINDVKEAMSGMLSPEVREVFIGLAEVRDVFRSSAFGQVAGCLVVEGTVRRGNPIRVLRDNVVIFQGELESLRRHRDDVKEVPNGTECGIAIKDYNDVQAGDSIECYEQVEVARKV